MLEGSQRSVLAVDLGGTKIIAAVILPDGKVISRDYRLTLANEGPEVVINRLISAVGGARTKAKLKATEPTWVAVAAAGLLDIENGLVTDSPNLPGWCNVPLRDILAERLGLIPYLINDASAAAFGEYRFGAGKGMDNMVYLTVSTGIGGGIIADGKLYYGANGCAGELGHMTIEPYGPRCNCGNLGCLEVLASGTAIAREAIRCLKQGEASSIIELANGKLEDITAKTVSVAAKQGDPLACGVVAQAANYLGIGLANLVNIFNPDMIVIGGGVSKIGEMLLKPARKVVKERAFHMPARTVRIVRARLGNDAGIVGAAAYAFERRLTRGQ